MLNLSSVLKCATGAALCAGSLFSLTACSDEGSPTDSRPMAYRAVPSGTVCNVEEEVFPEERSPKDGYTDLGWFTESAKETVCRPEEDGYLDQSGMGYNSRGDSYTFICDNDGEWRRVGYVGYQCFVKGLKPGDECVAYAVDDFGYGMGDPSYLNNNEIQALTYTECGTWEIICSSNDDPDCIKELPSGVGAIDLNYYPKRACTEANEMERIKMTGLNFPRYFVCKDNAWELTGRTDYECPPEKAHVGDVCEYYNLDAQSSDNKPIRSSGGLYGKQIHAVFTAEGVWDDPQWSRDGSISPETPVYTGSVICNSENEGLIDTLIYESTDSTYSGYDYFKCASNDWYYITEEQFFCTREGLTPGDTCSYTSVFDPVGVPQCTEVKLRYEGVGRWNSYAERRVDCSESVQ